MKIATQSFGLTERDLDTLYAIFQKYPAVKQINLFGSRAKGDYKKGSDIDLVIMNEGVAEEQINAIKAELEESSLPYFVDLIDYPKLKHQELINHISRVSLPFYTRTEEH